MGKKELQVGELVSWMQLTRVGPCSRVFFLFFYLLPRAVKYMNKYLRTVLNKLCPKDRKH